MGLLPGVSACLIVRDEERMLGECLRSLAGFVDEICVVDTGSRDGTIEVARAAGARVEHFAWRDDFSAARNRSLEMARHAWILVVDADEELVAETGPALREAIARDDATAFLLVRDDLRADGRSEPVPLVRLFRNDPRVRFELPVHESVMGSLFAIGCPSPTAIDVRLRHKGYLPDVLARVDKNARNLAILRAAVKERPGEIFAWWKLGQTLVGEGELDDRIAALEEAARLADAMTDAARAERPWLPRVHEALAEALARKGALAAAITAAERGLQRHADVAELLHRRGDLALRVGDLDRAERLFTATIEAAKRPAMYGRPPELATTWPTIGRARVAFARGAGPRGFELLRAAMASSPADVEARCLWVAHKFAARDLDGGLAVFGSLMPEIARSPLARTLAGDVAWLQGDVAGAVEMWQLAGDCRALGFDPHSRLALEGWIAGQGEARALLATIDVRDVSTAGCVLVLATACDLEPTLDPALRADAVVAEARRWVDRFVRGRGPRAHAELVRLAKKREKRFPGLAKRLS